MDQLDLTQREAVIKMSTDRLCGKLEKVGFDKQQLANMSREQLLDAYALELLKPAELPVAAAVVQKPVIGYDVELERRRFEFEMIKFEREEARRNEEIEREETRRKDALALQELELRVRRDQFDWQKSRDIREQEKQQTPAAQVKFFGSVLKNVMPKFPTDAADVPIFFEGVEKLFTSFEVPEFLRAKLLLPYLSDKVKSLLLRLDQSKQDKYSEVKLFLLNELKLTPIQFKERFDCAIRDNDETYTMFCSRLKNLLTYYCNSRNVKDSFKTLFSLLVADKIKSTLPEACLGHVLTAEGNATNAWLECDELAQVIDVYFASHTVDGRPKLARTDFRNKSNTGDKAVHRPNNGSANRNVGLPNQTQVRTGVNSEHKGAAVSYSTPASKGSGLCYTCASPSHKHNACPLRGMKTPRPGDNREIRGTPRNFACSVETNKVGTSANPLVSYPPPLGHQGEWDSSPRSKNSCSQPTNGDYAPSVMQSTGATYHSSRCAVATSGEPMLKSLAPPASSLHAISVTSNTAEQVYRNARAAIANQNEMITHDSIVDKLSKLNYIPIAIHGIDGIHDALHDSGSEINLIKRDMLQRLAHLPSHGRVKIRGVVGPAVETDIVLLDVTPTATEVNCVNIAPPLREIFAVCDELNESIILTADTVNRLSALKTYESVVLTKDVTALSNNVETNDDQMAIQNTGIAEISDNDTVTEIHYEVDSKSADTVSLISEQQADPALVKYYDLIRNGNKQFFLRDGLLFRHGKVNGNQVDQLCLPQGRIETVLKLAHDMPASGHQAARRTNDRIALSFFFPGQWSRVKQYCDSCEICQMRARERRTDLVPIKPIDRHEENFGHLQADIIGPMGTGQYQYALVLTDIQSRFINAYELTAPTAKNVVDKIILHSSYFGLPRYISFDCGSHFTSELTKVCLERLGVAPRFHCPYNPRGAGIVERSNSSVKQVISKLAADHPSSWHKILPFALWCLRTSVNETLGISPYQAVFGKVAIGPLQLICDDWIGKRPLPLDIAKSPFDYLQDLERKLQLASDYASEHATREQARYTHSYNLRSRDKDFQVGQRVIYLMPASTHKLTRTWQGPCVVVQKNSPYSYIIEFDGKRQWCHANHLRKYNERVTEVVNHNCAIIYDTDNDFGIVPTVYCNDSNDCDEVIQNANYDNGTMIQPNKMFDYQTEVSSSTSITVIDETNNSPLNSLSLPSVKIDKSKLAHLSVEQQRDLLEILDEFADCFEETPGFCPYVEHSITIDADFKPKRLREYRIPEVLKPEVRRQIEDLLKNGFIRPSNSPMASPIVAVLKGPSGKSGVRLTVDYRFVNLHSSGDAFVMPHLLDSIQKVGAARYISLFDARSGYWQLGVKESCKWLTAFAYEGALYEWNRMPFGMKCSGNSFCRCIEILVAPIRDFCFPFVDDMTVCSDNWTQHLSHLFSFLREIRKSGLTLSLQKCSLAQHEVRFVGHIVGSGRHRPDADKLATISSLAKPVTKKDVRKMVGFFNYFHSYISSLAELCVPFTNVLAKDKPNIVVWSEVENLAFERLKQALTECVKANLYVAQWGKPFGIHCDASKIAIGSCLVQWDDEGRERPISFASSKLSGAQLNWAAIEKEAYAIIWSLNKFKTWIFGASITIFADSNPLTYLTASAPKSAKLTRWALALQEFNITFKYTKGSEHVVPDYLSRPN